MLLPLAFIESGILYLVICGAMLAWAPTASWSDQAPLAPMMGQGLTLFLCCAAAFYLLDLYDVRVVGSFEDFSSRLPRALGLAALLLALLAIVSPLVSLPPQTLVAGMLAVPGVMLPLRALVYGVLRSEPFTERVLILGTNPLAARLIRAIAAHARRRWVVTAVCGDREVWETMQIALPCAGPIDRLAEVVERVRPERIVVAMTERRGRMPVRELAELKLRGIAVEDGVDLYESLTGRLYLESLTTSGVIFHRGSLRPRLYHAVSRTLSLLFSALVLILLGPLMLLIAAAIRLDSRGPVFFIQRRIGLRGEPFRMIKFRTMHPVEREVSVWAGDNGDRVTRAGRWLRKFRLDELPQLLNVLRGDMNLVGPRPHPSSNYGLYLEKIPHYWLRCLVRPGVTGWAQVRYRYANGLDEEIEKMGYDLYYIKHASPRLDLRILLDTVKLVLLGREPGASAISPVAPREGHPGRGGEQAA